MGGFCAGIYKWGVDFIQVFIILFLQVDVLVGGKLGIDFFGVKNSIGFFCDLCVVWVDLCFF